MKIINNTINFYNNVVIINYANDNKTIINSDNQRGDKMSEGDLSNLTPCIVINDNNDHPLIAQLEARILQSELEVKKLLDKNNETK
ncbi:MAG: hypothetical protein NVS3B13_40590 [Mucilaginibacter sp.]